MDGQSKTIKAPGELDNILNESIYIDNKLCQIYAHLRQKLIELKGPTDMAEKANSERKSLEGIITNIKDTQRESVKTIAEIEELLQILDTL